MNRLPKRQRFSRLLLLAASLILVCASAYFVLVDKNRQTTPDAPAFREGDIIFQITTSPQSGAIQLATGSQYTHCGVLFEKDGQIYVFEAIKTVSWTPVEQWTDRGVDKHFVLMRLKSDRGQLAPTALQAMKRTGQDMEGKPYDLLFQWSDDKIYCSELVWKIYERGANITLAPLRTLKEYHLDSALVRAIIKERYGHEINLDERVIAPSDLMKSPLLEKIYSN